MLRVGGGSAKGRLLKAPREERPTLGRMKQTLFDMLAPRLEGSRFLDVFAGSGAVGIEALSRGAEWAGFVEVSPRNCRLIRENLALCGFSEKAEVICAKAERGISRLAKRGEGFQIVFLDPPYEALEALGGALTILAEKGPRLVPSCLVIVQRSRHRPIREVPEALEVFDSRRIGESVLDFLRRRPV